MNQAPKHNPPRRRPTRWICQCFNYVTENCRWGAYCKYGHRGDRYLDNPEVVQEFKDGRCITPPNVPKAMREGKRSNKSGVDPVKTGEPGVDPVKAGEPVVPSGQSVKTHFKKAVRQNRHRESNKAQDGKIPTVAVGSAGGSKVTDTVNAHEVKAKETESTGSTKHGKESPKHADKQYHESSAKKDTPKLTSSAGNSAGKRPKRKNNHRGLRQGADATTTAQSQKDVKPQTEAVVNKNGNKANVSETKPIQTGPSKESDSVGDKLVKKEDANKPGDPTSNTPTAKKELQPPKLSYKTVLVQGVKVPNFPVQTNDKEVASEIKPKAVEPQVPEVVDSQTTHQDVEKPVKPQEKNTSETPSVVPATAKWSNEEFPSPVETKEPALDSKSLNPDAVEFVPVATDVIHSQPHTGPYSFQEPSVTQSTIPQPGPLLPEIFHPQPRLPIVFGTAPYIEVNRTKIVSPGGRVYLGFIDTYGRPIKMSPEIMDRMTTMPQFIGPPSEPGVVHPFPEPGPGFMRTVGPNDQVNWISTPTPGNGPKIAPTQSSPSNEGPTMFRYPIPSRDGRGRNHSGHGHDHHNSSHVIDFQSNRKPSETSLLQPQYQTPLMEYASEAQNNGGYMQVQTPPDDQQFNVGGYNYPHLGDAYNSGFEYPANQGFAPGFQGYHGPPQGWYPQLPVAPVFMPQGMTDGEPGVYYDPEVSTFRADVQIC
jgi:hypothetical protein